MADVVTKDDAEFAIPILRGLLNYSRRCGFVGDANKDIYCKEKENCPEQYIRSCYEQALETAIRALADHQDDIRPAP